MTTQSNRLRRELGIDLDNLPRRARKPLTPGTQIEFAMGDIVHREGDERHLGSVVAVNGNYARVLWPDFGPALGEGVKEDIEQDELVLIERKRRSPRFEPGRRPATIVESPRSKLERFLARRQAP